jgi:hypothetical protein
MAEQEKVNTDARINVTVRQVAKALEAKGVLPEAAKEMAEKHAHRIFVSRDGTIRVLDRAGVFIPPDAADPTGRLVSQLYGLLPADAKVGPASEEDLAANKRQLKRSGAY